MISRMSSTNLINNPIVSGSKFPFNLDVLTIIVTQELNELKPGASRVYLQ
jgi:hypothetical protein